jgi:replicative DNA helicase
MTMDSNTPERSAAGCLPVAAFVDAAMERARGEPGRSLAGLSTGFPSIDACTAGLRIGSLNVIAGRPAMGTTSLALNIAHNVALKQKLRVAIFSLNSPGNDIAERLLVAAGRIDRSRLDRGLLSAHERGAMEAACAPMATAPICIDESSFRLTEISRECRRLKDRFGDIGLIVIDPLHILLDAETDNRTAHDVIAGIKSLATENGAAVLLTTAVSRRVENRKSWRRVPRLTDLPEYSVLAELADLVMAIYREDYYKPRKHNAGDAVIHVLRDRYRGFTGGIHLQFDGACGLFTELR